METDYLKLAAENQKRAREVIAESQIEQIWQRHGATVNLVGSLATGLLMKHRDIDFHVYTAAEPEVAVSFAAMAELAKNPRIKRNPRNLFVMNRMRRHFQKSIFYAVIPHIGKRFL